MRVMAKYAIAYSHITSIPMVLQKQTLGEVGN